MTIRKTLHPIDDVNRYVVSRKEGGRGHSSIEDSADPSKWRLEVYIKSAEKNWLQRLETPQTKQASREQK